MGSFSEHMSSALLHFQRVKRSVVSQSYIKVRFLSGCKAPSSAKQLKVSSWGHGMPMLAPVVSLRREIRMRQGFLSPSKPLFLHGPSHGNA